MGKQHFIVNFFTELFISIFRRLQDDLMTGAMAQRSNGTWNAKR